ncbi:MAG: hypothetical protein M1839_006772 [Geoglossum umbratile]|nr:MAG: hypothetical protein M1839_006772 [Geoglossum umbratile]
MPVLRQRALNLSDSSTDSSGSGGSFTTSGLSPSPMDHEDTGFPLVILTHNIGKDHSIVECWEPSLRTIVIEHLNLRSNEWIALDVLRRGWSREPVKCEPTIVITLKRGTEVGGVWDAIVQNIREISVAKCGSTIEVEILLGELSRLGQSSWEEIPTIGSSIGLAGSLNSGTVGGFLDLRTSSQTVRVGLTCHHVLCAEHSEAIPMGSELSIVNQPSDTYHADQVKQLEESLEETLLDMQRTNGRTGGYGNDAYNKICSNHMATVKTLLELATDFRRQVGTTFATSGLTVSASRGCSLDWGLVKLEPSRYGTNELPHEPTSNGMIMSGITRVDSIAPIQVGSSVIKGGYKTGWTRGICNEIKSHCKLPGGPEDGTPEYCIVSGKPGIPFSLGGDSGAWVLRPNGKLGGMVIGGVLDGRWSYMTPIEAVIEDIENVMGGTCNVAEG